MEIDTLLGWAQIIFPVIGVAALLLVRIIRIQQEQAQLKEAVGRLESTMAGSIAELKSSMKELLPQDVFIAKYDTIEGYIRYVDKRLARIERKVLNNDA